MAAVIHADSDPVFVEIFLTIPTIESLDVMEATEIIEATICRGDEAATEARLGRLLPWFPILI